MIKLKISEQVEKKIKRGIQLLERRDFPNLQENDKLVNLYNTKGKYLGIAYLSQQNKGVGWYLSEQEVKFGQEYFKYLLKEARNKRSTYFQDELTTAYRLFNQDGDFLGGLTIDRYGDYALFSWYNTFIYKWRNEIISAFRQVYPEIIGAYEKIRFKGGDFETAHVYGEEEPEDFKILENGVSYKVFLNDGLMTGIFLDQHEVRGRLVDGLSSGKRMLNLFSYTAAFSVAAAMGGALTTTSVDLAKRSRELSLAHFEANHLDLDKHDLIVMDVFSYFKYAKRHNLKYDVIVIDPPSFARNKKQTFSVVKDYHKLVSESLEILSPKGILVLSTNASNINLEKFKSEIDKGMGNIAYQYMSIDRLPSDFRCNKKDESSNYLKVVTIRTNI